MPSDSKLSEIRDQIKRCHQELVDLERRAGIAEDAEKLRTEPPNYLGIYDAAERYSDEQRELEATEEAFHHERVIRRLRDLYFSVRDADLRKALITKDRDEGDLGLSYCQQELSDASSKHKAALSAHQHWWVWASVVGIIFVGIGFHFFGLPGSLGGLLVGYLNGRQMEHQALRARESAVAEAAQELKEAEDTWNKARNQQQTFSQREAKSGERDPEQDHTLHATL